MNALKYNKVQTVTIYFEGGKNIGAFVLLPGPFFTTGQIQHLLCVTIDISVSESDGRLTK